MKPYVTAGRPRGILLILLATVSVLIAIASPASGATPPQFPHLTVTISGDPLLPGEDLEISAVWYRDASLYLPPESVSVRLYSVPSGLPVAGYTIPKDEHTASEDSIRHFRGVIPSSELPAGRFLVVVTDPISGADARVAINVTEPGPDYPDIQRLRHADTVFFGIAAVLMLVLAAGLGLLLRRP